MLHGSWKMPIFAFKMSTTLHPAGEKTCIDNLRNYNQQNRHY